MTVSINPKAVRPIVGPADAVLFKQSGNGAVSRSSQDKMREIEVHVKDFGAVVDGATDDVAAFRAAVTYLNSVGGGILKLAAGTMRVVLTATNTVSLGANITIRGLPTSVISVDSDSPGSAGSPGDYRQLFGLNGNNITFQDFKIAKAAPYTQMVVMVLGQVTWLRMDGVTVDGAANVASASYCHVLQFGSSGNAGNIVWTRCTLTNCNYVLLMTNASTGTVSNLLFDSCIFTNNYADDLGFNSPNGSITDVHVRDCSFSNNQSVVSSSGFAVSFAFVRRAVIRGCFFTGYNNEAIHIEDWSDDIRVEKCSFRLCGSLQGAFIRIISGALRIKIDGCTLDATSNTNATPLHLIESLAGGSGTTPGGRSIIAPSYVSVTNNDILVGGTMNGVYFEAVTFYRYCGNNMVGSGLVSAGSYSGTTKYGLFCYTGASGVISNNLFRGLLWAIRPMVSGISAYGAGTTISGNTFRDCSLGLPLLDLDPGVTATGNSFNNCVHTIILGRGGTTLYANPAVVACNNSSSSTYPMAISSPYTVRRAAAAGTVSIGAGVTVSVIATDVYLPSGTVLTFSGGGVLTLTSPALSQAVSLVGNLTTASIAGGETASFASALPVGTVVANNNG